MIDQHQPLVSVILPVRNGEATLAAAINSIIQQTYRNWELLVFDDGSVDRTREVVHDATRSDTRIKRFCDGQRKGLARSLNELVARSHGTLVARMDADDVSYPRRLELQVGFMLEHRAVDLLGTSMIVVSAEGKPVGKRAAPSEHDQITRHPGIGFPMYHPTWLGRAAWFRTHPYRAVARRCEDQDLLLRTYLRSTLANLTEPLLGYRAGGDLRATLRGRWSFVSRSIPTIWGQLPLEAATGIGWHAGRATIDAAAASTGLEDRLLRYRIAAISASERHEWEQVMRSTRGESDLTSTKVGQDAHA